MGNQLNLTKPIGTPVYNDNTSVTIPVASWVQLVSSLPYACSAILVANTGANPVSLGVGAAAAEVEVALIPVGTAVVLPINLAKGQRLSARAKKADVNTGALSITLLV